MASGPVEIADEVFCLPTDYDRVGDVPLFVYLVATGASVLVDAGIPSTYERALAGSLARCGISPDAIRMVLITHAHPDHHGGANRLRAESGASIAMPLDDIPWAERVDRQWHGLWDAYPGVLDLGPQEAAIRAMCGGDLAIDVAIRDRQLIETGRHRLEAVQTRGHSPGHCAYLDHASGSLFTGDSVQGHGLRSITGDTVTAPMYHDVDEYVAGLKRLQALTFSVLCPAHAPSMDEAAGRAAIQASVDFVEEIDALLLEMIGTQATVTTRAVAEAIGRHVGSATPITIQTVVTATAHLQRAARRGWLEPTWTRPSRQPADGPPSELE